MIVLLLALLPLLSCEREEPEINFDMPTFDMAAEGGTVTVNLTTNYSWKATCSDPWLVVTPTSGKKGTSTVKIQVAANEKHGTRKGAVSFDCRDMVRAVNITQMPNFEQSLVIRHQSSSFTVPSMTGSSFAAMVYWGDGKEEAYRSGISHDYGQSAGSYSLEIKSTGAYTFSLKSVAGVSEIDFLKF